MDTMVDFKKLNRTIVILRMDLALRGEGFMVGLECELDMLYKSFGGLRVERDLEVGQAHNLNLNTSHTSHTRSCQS